MRLIDADALKEYVKIFDIGCGCDDDHHERFLDAIDDAPTIKLKRKTGHWHTLRDASSKQEYLTCSKCTNRYPANAKYWNFCPNCGSYNGGENEG